MLTIDQYQPDQEFMQIASSSFWAGYKIESRRLSVGDFIMSYKVGRKKADPYVDLVGIESKKWNDLLGSIAEKRVQRQLTRLQAAFPRADGKVACLLVRGSYEESSWEVNAMRRTIKVRSGRDFRDTGWTVGEVEGFLLKCQDRGIKVLRLDNENDLPAFLKWVYDHYARSRGKATSFFSGSEVLLAQLDAFPGVGPERAIALVQAAVKPTLGGVRKLKEATLQKLVGPQAGHKVWEALQ